LRQEHMKNMEIRATLTYVMVTALAAIFGLSSWFRTANTFHVLFFVPALVGVWGEFVYHSYHVFFRLQCYLRDLEESLGMRWTERNPPTPSLWAYMLVLAGSVAASLYFVAALEEQPLTYIISRGWSQVYQVPRLIQAPSTVALGCIAWLFGTVLSMWVLGKFAWLSHKFCRFPDRCPRTNEQDSSEATSDTGENQ